MRDIALVLIFPFLLYCAIKRPFIGLALWLWSSLVPLNMWSYGFSTSFRWNFIFAFTTIIGYFLSSNKQKFKGDVLITLVVVFTCHITVSCLFHVSHDANVWGTYDVFIKTIIFFIFACVIVQKKLHVDALLWACVMSIGARAAIDGIKIVFSGGGHVVRPLTTMFSDNNLGALACLMVIPVTMYLFNQYKHTVVKIGLGGFIFLNVMFVIGSDSRGGFLGLLALGAYFFWNSKRKFSVLAVITVLSLCVLFVADEQWFNRMNTIEEADEDGSFLSRIMAWKLSVILALNNPVFGGGFNAVAYGPTFYSLRAQFGILDFIPSPYPSIPYVAHSIYFQVLGDTGFVGFFWYCAILFFTFKGLSGIRKTSSTDWITQLTVYIKLSFLAFLVSGAALSSPYNSIFFTLIASTVVLKRLSKAGLN